MEARMSVKVLFFGSIAARLGKRKCSLPVNESMTVENVVRIVGCAAFKPLLIAVNQIQVKDMNTTVKADDEVAIMPPFSGG